MVVKDERLPVVDLLMSLQENSHASVRYCSIFGVKVEEVAGNVLMTFCDCDDCTATGFCGNVVVTVVEVI